MDNLVALYNVNAYNSGKLETLDVNYMSNALSESAVPYLIAIAQSDDKELAPQAQRCIIDKIRYDMCLLLTENNTLEYGSKTDFREFNLTVKTAKELICDYFNALPETERAKYRGSITLSPYDEYAQDFPQGSDYDENFFDDPPEAYSPWL